MDLITLPHPFFLSFLKALKKFEVERYRQEKLSEQQSKILTKQLNELHELEERAAQANVLRKTFRYFLWMMF